MKFSTRFLPALLLLSVFIAGCGATGTAAVTAPKSLWDIHDSFQVTPATGTGHMIEINPISDISLHQDFGNVDFAYFGVYTFSNGTETKVIVSPILSLTTPSFPDYTLTEAKYFEAFAVEVQSGATYALVHDTGSALQKLCHNTPGCQ